MQNQEDGLYPNTFSRAFKAAASSAQAAATAAAAAAAAPVAPSVAAGAAAGAAVPALLPGLKADLQLVTSIYATYIKCGGGQAEVITCGPGTFFDFLRQGCVPTARNETAGVAPVPGCRNASCFCTGRRDGLFPSPEKLGSGVVCSGQKAYLLDCPSGFAFQDGMGCAPTSTPGFFKPRGAQNPALAGAAAAAQGDGAPGAAAAADAAGTGEAAGPPPGVSSRRANTGRRR